MLHILYVLQVLQVLQWNRLGIALIFNFDNLLTQFVIKLTTLVMIVKVNIGVYNFHHAAFIVKDFLLRSIEAILVLIHSLILMILNFLFNARNRL